MHYKIFYNGGSNPKKESHKLDFKESEKNLLKDLGLKDTLGKQDINEVKNDFDSYITPESLDDSRLKGYLQHCISECGGHQIELGDTLPEEFAGEGPNGPRPEGANLGVLEKYWCNWHNKNCDTMCYGDIYKKMGAYTRII